MATKKEFNIEELKKQCLEAEQTFKELREQLLVAEKKEEEDKKAKLEAEKELRHKGVVDAYKRFEKLKTDFIKDYGYFSFKTVEEIPSLYDFFVGLR